MVNRKLIAGLLSCALCGHGICAFAQKSRVYTLEEIFESADRMSKAIKVSEAEMEATLQGIKVAKDARLPEIGGQLSLSYIGNGFTTDRRFGDYQTAKIPHTGNGLTLSLEQPLYTGGAITHGIAITELNNTAARYATELKRDDIRLQLTGYYLDLYKLKNLLIVTENNIRQAESVLTEMNARFKEGIIIENDITRYELLISNLYLQKTNIENAIGILNTELVITAGLDAGTIVETDTTIVDRVLPLESEERWKEEASSHSPVLKLAETAVEIGNRNEAAIKSDRLPKIGLRAAWTMDGPILTEVPPINRNLGYWYVGIGVNYQLSSLYKTRKKAAEAKSRTLAAKAELENKKNEIDMAVNADYVKYTEAYEILKNREKGLELAEKNYKTTKARYDADMALISDMVDAVNSKIEAEQQLINTRIDIIYYYYKLLFTTGKI